MKRGWKRAIVVGISLIISTGIYFTIQWANSPSKQAIYPEVAAAIQATPLAEMPITTKFFTTNIPPGFRTQTAENPKNPSMIQFTAFATDNSDIQVGITTSLLPSDGLDGVADYLYRLKNDAYKQAASTAFPVDSPTFYKQSDGSEITSFLRNGNRYASVVISSRAASTTQLEGVVETVAKNWQWL